MDARTRRTVFCSLFGQRWHDSKDFLSRRPCSSGQMLSFVTSHTKLALCSGRDQRPLIDVDHLTPALKALALDTIVQKGVETHACECSVQRRLLPRTNWVQYDAGQDFQGEAKRALKILYIYIYRYRYRIPDVYHPPPY